MHYSLFTIRYSLLLAIHCSLFVLSGCGEKTPYGMPKLLPCEVKVTQDGAPLAGAVVTLSPAEQSPWNASGSTDSGGTAKIFTQGRYAGATAGKYKVTLQKTDMERKENAVVIDGKLEAAATTYYLVEEKYRYAATTPLEIEVKSGAKTYTVDAGKAVREKDERK